MISSYTFGGAIHLLLVFALIVLVIRLAQGSAAACRRSLIFSDLQLRHYRVRAVLFPIKP